MENFYLINLNKNLNLIVIMKLSYLYKPDDERQNRLRYSLLFDLEDIKELVNQICHLT